MPVSTIADASREIDRLSALLASQVTTNRTQADQIAALNGQLTTVVTEMATLKATVASCPDQIRRIADALNQFGRFQTALIQNQTLAPTPSQPWGDV